MKTEITFTGTSPSRIRTGKNDVFWFGAVCIAFVVWSYLESSLVPMIIFSVFFAISLLLRTPFLQRKIYIKVGGDALSVQSENEILWKTLLQDITSIELMESKRLLSAETSKALLIRNNRDDSYYLPLDGVTFEGHSPASLVEKLNEIKKSA